MNKNTITRHSGSSHTVKNELKKCTQITNPSQVEQIKLYIGVSKLTETFKTFYIPTGIENPQEIWASQNNPHPEWSEIFHIKINDRNDWQIFDCPMCGHEVMLRTQYETGTEIKTIPPSGECEYCKTKYPKPTVRKPQLSKRNNEYKTKTTIN